MEAEEKGEKKNKTPPEAMYSVFDCVISKIQTF